MLVPVLAPSYNQHILSSAKFKKVWYSLTEICITSDYFEFILVGWGVKFMKHFKSYESFGTSGLFDGLTDLIERACL
jgi:hypothetical protein